MAADNQDRWSGSRWSEIWEKTRAALGITTPCCRECEHEVTFFSDVCPHCGVQSPVRLSTWLNYAALGVTLWLFLLLIL